MHPFPLHPDLASSLQMDIEACGEQIYIALPKLLQDLIEDFLIYHLLMPVLI